MSSCPFESTGLKVSLEFKPTDENTRWFAVPSTGVLYPAAFFLNGTQGATLNPW